MPCSFTHSKFPSAKPRLSRLARIYAVFYGVRELANSVAAPRHLLAYGKYAPCGVLATPCLSCVLLHFTTDIRRNTSLGLRFALLIYAQ
ncbi:MAG: hypothetical protein IJD77_04250 [Clostridia bacterium]|nr:hypothetical protein [Clostridia bacterium]